MGILVYGADRTEVVIEDRTLMHLRAVFLAKLRRSESFAFTWSHADAGPDRVVTTWVHPAIDLEFQFDRDPRGVALNKQWADVLMHSANSVPGLEVLPEHTPGAGAPDELSGAALPR